MPRVCHPHLRSEGEKGPHRYELPHLPGRSKRCVFQELGAGSGSGGSGGSGGAGTKFLIPILPYPAGICGWDAGLVILGFDSFDPFDLKGIILGVDYFCLKMHKRLSGIGLGIFFPIYLFLLFYHLLQFSALYTPLSLCRPIIISRSYPL